MDLQNWFFFIFDVHFPHFWPFSQLWELIWPTYALQSTSFDFFCLQTYFFLSWIYRVLNGKLVSKCQFCIFDLHCSQIMSLFAAVRASTANLCLTKYIFGLVFFARLSCLSIYGFNSVSSRKVVKKRRFCIFDLRFIHFRTRLYFYHPNNIHCGIYAFLKISVLLDIGCKNIWIDFLPY